MHRPEYRHPTYNLTTVEGMFSQLIRNDIYEDNASFTQQIIKLKSRFMLQNVQLFEKQLEKMTMEEIEEKEMK